MGPLPQSDGHDPPGLIDEAVPGEAAVIDDVVVGFEDAVRQPVVAHELPDVFDRVEFGTPRRKRHQGDIGRHDEVGGAMPSSLIENDDGMSAGCDMEGDFLEMHVHCCGIAARHDDAGSLAFSGTDRTKDPG